MRKNVLDKILPLAFIALSMLLVQISCENGGGTGSSGPENGAISGHIYLEGSLKPIAEVVASCGGTADTTQKSGHYLISNLPTGSQTVTATNQYYETYRTTVIIKANETATLDIFMQYDESAK